MEMREHEASVNRLAVAEDNAFFVSCSDDGTVKIWDCARLEKGNARRSRLTFSSGKLISHGKSGRRRGSGTEAGRVHGGAGGGSGDRRRSGISDSWLLENRGAPMRYRCVDMCSKSHSVVAGTDCGRVDVFRIDSTLSKRYPSHSITLKSLLQFSDALRGSDIISSTCSRKLFSSHLSRLTETAPHTTAHLPSLSARMRVSFQHIIILKWL